MSTNFSRRKFITTAAALATGLPALQAGTNENYPSITNDNSQVFLFQGDSITDGNRGRNADPNHIMGHGYAFSIASRIGADFPNKYTFYNRGISGNTIIDLKNRWQQDTIDLQPDILSILVGINDVNAVIDNRPTAQSTDAFENNYRELLTVAKAAKPDISFVLGLPFVYPVGKRKDNYDKWKAETIARAERVTKLAKEFNAVLVDYPAVFDKAIAKAPIEYWIWDGIHPTVPAHELMAREWIKQMTAQLPFLKKYKHE
ncbi:MAG: SGNH/GDSL hydrolase family protein [Chitinophagaceae bacterium]